MDQPLDPPRDPLAASPPIAAAPAPAPAPPPLPRLGEAEVRRIIFGLMLAMFLSALDQTIVATALPAIGRELADVHNLAWVVTAYLLAATAVTPLYGKLSDIHGRRVMLLIGIGVFAAGSLACAVSTSMPALILARAAQGLGGGGLIALAQTIIADILSPRERSRYQAYFGAVFAGASILGPVLGGVFADHLHWSAIFWINLPLGAAALAMSYRALRLLPVHHRPHRLDVAGAALMAAATVALLLALTWGGTRYPWRSGETAGLLAASAVLWAGFALRLATAPEPFLPLAVLANGVVRNGTLAACFAMGTMIGLSIYVPVYLQAVVGLSASRSGLALIPLMGGTVAGATASGRMMARVAHYRRLPAASLACGIAALATLAAAPPSSLAAALGLFAVAGVAVGALFPVTTVAIQNAVRPYELGTATASMNFFRQLGGAIAVAGYGAIMLSGLGAAGAELAAETFARAGTAAGPAGGAALAAVFRWIFAAAALGLALALAFLLRMEERPLRDRPPAE
jgi:EmrB/QacA subfamily drug resistance transporter